MFLLVRRLVERSARWLVRHVEPLDLAPTVDAVPGRACATSPRCCPSCWSARWPTRRPRPTARFTDAGVPADLARRVAVSDSAVAALPAVALAAEHDIEPQVVVRIQFLLDDRLGLDRVRDRIAALPRADRWQTEARAALRDDFYESQHALTAAVLAETELTGAPEARVDAWLAEHEPAVTATGSSSPTSSAPMPADLAALAVVRRALRDLAALD